MNVGGISIHGVDVSTGRPAEGLAVRLSVETPKGLDCIAEGVCGPTGLFDDPTVQGTGIRTGAYVAEFFIGDFYAVQATDQKSDGFLDVAVFRFKVLDLAQHYHLPLKFTAWGYSLFRGGL